jgi:hypothetical protein
MQRGSGAVEASRLGCLPSRDTEDRDAGQRFGQEPPVAV